MQADWRDNGELFGVNGHRIHTPEQQSQHDTDGTGWTIILLPLVITAGLVWWALRHPATAILSAVMLAGWLSLGVPGLVAVLAVTAGVLVGWWHWLPRSFDRWITDRARTAAKSWWVYRRRWHATMALTGLAATVDGAGYEPAICAIRCGKYVDRVRVRMLSGQQPEHWDLRADALAATFGALTCRVRLDSKPGRVWLDFTHHDSLSTSIAALDMPETVDDVDLAGVPVGICETGDPWCLRLTGAAAAHLLIGGASGAGKSSVVWSLLRSLGPAISSGLVQVWAVDPKGGMELAPGQPLFTRFGYGTPQQLCDLMVDAEQLVHERTDRLRGHARHHTPAVADPLVVLVIDEIASVTSYLTDRQVAKQITASLSVILSQGRAAGVVVIGAVQDPRKDIVPYRDLFPVRVGLRMTEAGQADMILGDSAHNRGARCEHIPSSQPGTGYVLAEGHREPIRVRAAHVTDTHITKLVEQHPAPLPDMPAESAAAVDAELAAILNPQPNADRERDE